MIYKTYKDFNDLFYNFNREIITKPFDFIGRTTNLAFLPFLVIECDNSNIDIDISKLNYTKRKFELLIKNYMNLDKFKNFLNKQLTSTGTSLTYYFNQEKPKKGTTSDNGPCLLNFVVTRNNRKKEWEEITFYFRSTELNRRFSCDLILFNKIIKELKFSNIKKIRLVMTRGYLDMLEACGQLDFFKIDVGELKEEGFVHDFMVKIILRILTTDKSSTYKKLKRVTNLLKKENKKLNPIKVEDLKIW